MASAAISSSAVSATVGYLLAKGYFNSTSPNLPQNISILAEANTANQSGLVTTPVQITTASQAATLYGYGSPMHILARILFPFSGSGVQVPVYAYPQLAAVSSIAKVITITPTGTATAAGTIYLKINGREIVDGKSYGVNIAVGDTPTFICNKFRTAIAGVLAAPVIGSGTATLIATAKWTGLTSNGINISVDLKGQDLGVTFGVVPTTSGVGTPEVTASLAMFNNEWKTCVINSYGLLDVTCDELEAFNGKPDPTSPTGRYDALIWRPFIALSGTTLDDPTSLTNRPNDVTIAACPAPLSEGLAMEAAANYAVKWIKMAQDLPHSSVLNQSLPDMPPPPDGSIPQMANSTFREYCVDRGCSTADLISGVYSIIDFVTTYNKVGEFPPFYRYCRDLNLNFNYKFGYHLIEQTYLIGKTIANDNDVVTANNVIKPKQWKAQVAEYNNDCVRRAIIVDASFSNSSIVVEISAINPNRIDTTLSYKLSGVVYQSATTVTQGFNFGQS